MKRYKQSKLLEPLAPTQTKLLFLSVPPVLGANFGTDEARKTVVVAVCFCTST